MIALSHLKYSRRKALGFNDLYKLLTWHNECKQSRHKKKIDRDLMSAAWHPLRK